MVDLVVASFNLHAGVDGWARPYDVVGACRRIDADVLVLEENWAPDNGRSLASIVADELGYDCTEVALARGRLRHPLAPPRADGGPASFGPRRAWRRSQRVWPFSLEGRRRAPGDCGEGAAAAGPPPHPAVEGSWGLALLSRLRCGESEVLEVAGLRRDRTRRAAVLTPVVPGADRGGEAAVLLVAGTHLGHLHHGSLRQMRGLAADLSASRGPAVVLGDLNCWGPLVLAMMPGWRRAVRGRTWPARRPHSQVDHILVRGGVRVLHAEVLAPLGSDHRAVRARIALADAPAAPARRARVGSSQCLTSDEEEPP